VRILIHVQSAFAIWTIPESYVERLRSRFPEHTFLHARSDDDALAMIAEADVMVAGQITPELLAAARRLRWLHSPAAGVGGMLFREMRDASVVLSNSRGMSAGTIAEHVVAVTLALFRRLPDAARAQARREWAQDAIGTLGNRLLANSSVLIVGLGSIGGAVADKMTLLGARVTGLRRNRLTESHDRWNVASVDRLHELLPLADVVVLSAPHTRETRHVIGREALALMSPRAVVVNVSRGPLIDEDALVDALRAQRIAGAALDVFVDEPLPPDSPFWTLPNVLITPHTSGFRPDHWDAVADLFSENLRRFIVGEPLLNVVDKQAGY
jgi:phosphoglycerate dehydrogenase-like enzyme